MPSLSENKRVWDGEYSWREQGEEWSAPWGGAAMQWYGAILPRIHRFLPTRRILEIAPGYGRWTAFLLPQSEQLTAVDLSAECIEACRQRFGDRVELHVNDGSSLSMCDGPFDLVFSFDSLVHVEADALEAYIAQLVEKLSEDGVAFLHHSNAGEHLRYYRLLEAIPKGKDRLINMGVLDPLEPHWRARSVSADKVRGMITRAGLSCVSQELVNWRTTRREIDCFTTITRPGSKWEQATQVLRNPNFVRQTQYWRKLAELHGGYP